MLNLHVTVHNRIGLYLWKQDSIREFRTLFVTHMDSILIQGEQLLPRKAAVTSQDTAGQIV